jgi:3-hydroxybutyryl-CoA dehydrogenase
MVDEIKVVSIIGIGFMGKQIVEKSADKDYSIRMYDANPEGFDKYTRKIARRKRIKKASGDVSFHDTIAEAVKDADLIIEAIPEKLDLKKEIFSEIDKFAPPRAIIATNSSSIPVSKLEDSVKRKKKECFGFVFNRIWRAIKKESLKIWAGGHADIEVVDQAWGIYTGMGHGPFTLMDQVGLDVAWDIEMSYYKESGDPNDKPPQALKDMVDRGELGRKSGKGFYTY